MKIAICAEADAAEPRVAGTPETVKKMMALGADVAVEPGAGVKSGILDADYQAAGATVTRDAARDADIVLKVKRPNEMELTGYKKGAIVIAIMDPYGHQAALEALARAGVIAFAMELMPRITRAQVMDVLSSQANLAGYRAVIDASAEYGRAFPMMMTPAGTVPAAKCFIMGVGVAGLQAIATARRLGAIVTATDVRPAVKEQVASLGAKFIAVEDDEFKQAETAGGYAKEMSKEYQAKQAALVAEHIKKQDIVITTALIPGRPAPRLITAEMVASMKPGSVIVDLAVERGGNVEGAKPGEVVEVGGVKIVGHLNVAGRLAASSSALYSKNLLAFLEVLIDKKTKAIALNWDDEIVKATALTKDGAIVHPNFVPKTAA
ncbi:NAD(P) transhydrogenase subunit alpha [Rhodoplanes elegans]|uniref:NAD(P) transhydrogenase subunit alpha part 1 n=1 Tax=Rhodoplanes elegans TaxID=29408 RepID=A0A327KH51_9BRAD|nr:Re/Si-specific NAD(P)(+) transhydrogenase subunit alpha [Rhodoplanes elegans]MBK5961406.1 NAD(P) transhydrogenase subunit alpha [Rhodoplanes elegans]RAI37456.1 NAD(P)(+) transhydrogenase (Re/Si-specific) subunit alpha [Rhodoplanes elegans]